MRIELPYGTDKIWFEIDAERLAGIVEPNEVAIGDETERLVTALANPVGSPLFDQFLAEATELLVIVNDATRPTPTARMLAVIYDKIRRVRNHRFIVATGIHRAPTVEEYRQIFGELYDAVKDRVYAHDSKKDADLDYLGRSKCGTEMYINRMALAADRIIALGSVEPHYFAGYTGGRKALMPGIAGHRTIAQNHQLALDIRAQALALSGNPVHEDLEDVARAVSKPIFSVMAVLDKHDRIYAATAGDLDASFYAAIDRANEVFSVKIEEKADVVVSVAPYPMDIDLYQSQKALDNGKLALKENGILILVAKCRTGTGEEGFVRLLAQAGSPQEALEQIGRGYQIGYHKAAKMAEIGLWAQMWGVTDLDPAVMRSVFIRPFPSIQAAVDVALGEKGPGAKVLVLPNGSLTVPRV